jgi:hypothetical protein
MTLPEFELDPTYLTDVVVRQTWGMYDHKKPEELTHDEVIKILKGEDQCSSTGTKDHPEFSELREQLGTDGYIEIQRSWWNGDRVLKPFVFNGVEFEVGEKFCCACAMAGHLKFAKEYKK